MDNLEKVDLIRERLGVSYEMAHQALQEADGDVVQALIKLEKESVGKGINMDKGTIHIKGQEMVSKVKDIIKEGNVNKIVVKNKDRTLIEIPVTAGVVSLALFPYITLLAGLGAMYKEYTLEIEKEDDENGSTSESDF